MITVEQTQASSAGAEGFLEAKRSRFISFLARANSVEEAREAIAARKSRFPDARHNCSAFAVAVPGTNPVFHSSDDGEPSGTAGKPMLEVLRGSGLMNVAAVVTRYFGGTLLGTGGLVRAYSDALALAIENAQLVEVISTPLFEASFAPAEGGRIDAALRAFGFQVHEVRWESQVTIAVATAEPDTLSARLAELTKSAPAVHRVGTIETEVPLPA